MLCPNSFCVSAQPWYVYAIVGYKPNAGSYLTRSFTYVKEMNADMENARLG